MKCIDEISSIEKMGLEMEQRNETQNLMDFEIATTKSMENSNKETDQSTFNSSNQSGKDGILLT